MAEETTENTKSEQPASTQEVPQDLNALQQLSSSDDGQKPQVADASPGDAQPPKKKGWRRVLGFFNVYLLTFFLLLIVAGVIFVVSYINSQKEPELPETAFQELTQEALSEVATGDATVGDPQYVLTIQSDAVFSGSALIRGDLSVAGNIQLGQDLSVPNLTVSGAVNLGESQLASLAVAGESLLSGKVTMQNGLEVSGSVNFGGNLTVSSITTGSLTLAGNGNLTLNNHLLAAGPSPSRSQGNAVGAGGTTSLSGSDLAGTLNVNTGTGTSAGCFATITFVQAYNDAPSVMVTPVGAAAGQTQFYVTRTSTSFSICTANAAPTGQSFAYDYFVIN